MNLHIAMNILLLWLMPLFGTVQSARNSEQLVLRLETASKGVVNPKPDPNGDDDCELCPFLKEIETKTIESLLTTTENIDFPGDADFEASSIVWHPGWNRYLVIFDNIWEILMFNPELTDTSHNGPITAPTGLAEQRDSEFEGIALDPQNENILYMVSEAEQQTGGDDKWYPVIRQAIVDPVAWSYTIPPDHECFVDFEMVKDNKGLEGLEVVNYQGENRFIGLCEGNYCTDSKSRGNGRMLLIEFNPVVVETTLPSPWNCKYNVYEHQIHLPGGSGEVKFKDHAGLRVKRESDYPEGLYDMAIVSQKDSEVWVGTADFSAWPVVFTTSYTKMLPETEEGETQFCNVEGVEFRRGFEDSLVMCSDMPKADYDAPCGIKDQSLHFLRKRYLVEG